VPSVRYFRARLLLQANASVNADAAAVIALDELEKRDFAKT
jgi:hypothetical protein